jgi:hypothetical protein
MDTSQYNIVDCNSHYHGFGILLRNFEKPSFCPYLGQFYEAPLESVRTYIDSITDYRYTRDLYSHCNHGNPPFLQSVKKRIQTSRHHKTTPMLQDSRLPQCRPNCKSHTPSVAVVRRIQLTKSQFVFGILTSSGTFHANKYLTFNDLSHGIPSLILSCEVALLAPFFLIAYSCKRYMLGMASSESAPTLANYEGGPLGIKAIFTAINIVDIVGPMVRGIKASSGGME